MDKVLVTGGAGFIGSHLCPMLKTLGFDVRILDILSPQVHGESRWPDWCSEFECMKGSVVDADVVAKALKGVDVLVHLAAETGTGQSMYEIARYNEVNVQGTAVIMDALVSGDSKPKKVVLASSRSVYGEGAYICPVCNSGKRTTPDPRNQKQLLNGEWEPLCDECQSPLTSVPTHETDAIKTASVYAATKFAQEDLVRICCESMGVGFSIFRLQNVYGEGQSLQNPYTGILSIFSTKIRRGLEIPLFEDGNETRDFVHVSDVAGAMCHVIDSGSVINQVINVGTGQQTTVRTIAQSLIKALGADVPVRVTGEYRLGDIRHNKADIGRLVDIAGYAPKVDLNEGLRLFAQWVLTQSLPEDQLAKANNELRARNLMK